MMLFSLFCSDTCINSGGSNNNISMQTSKENRSKYILNPSFCIGEERARPVSLDEGEGGAVCDAFDFFSDIYRRRNLILAL